MAQPTLLRTASKAHDFTTPAPLVVDLTGAHAILVVAFQDSTADAAFSFTGCSISGSGLSFTAGTEVIWNTNASRRRAFWLTSNSIPSGSQTINVTWTGTRRGGYVVYVFNDAGASPAITIVGSTPVATTGSSPAAQSFTVTSTTAAAECLAFVAACNFQAFSGTLPATGSGGTTAVGYDNTSLVWQAWFSENGAATSTVMDWTWSTTGNNLSLFGFSITGSAPSATLGGNVTLADVAPSGGLSSVASSLSGNVTLADVDPTGTLGAQPGAFASEVLKDWTGAVQASTALTYYRLYNPTTGALVVSRTGLSTDSAGIVSFTDAALTAGTSYASDWLTASGARRMPVKAAA